MRIQSAWRALTAALSIELVLGIVLFVTMIPTFPSAGAERDALLPLWVSLFVSVILCCVWVAATLVGAIRRGGSWVRGSAVTLHILMFAAALGVFQGLIGTTMVGVILLVLAVVGFAAAILSGLPARGQAVGGQSQ